MNTLQQLKDELTAEHQTTKKFLREFPDGKNDYAPHAKSMKLMPLAEHIIEVFSWIATILKTEVLDFAEGKPAKPLENKQQLMNELERHYASSFEALNGATEAALEPKWSLAYKGEKLAEWTKYGAIRHALNQITHHRAQLGVYYRLNDINVPGSYGPSADDL